MQLQCAQKLRDPNFDWQKIVYFVESCFNWCYHRVRSNIRHLPVNNIVSNCIFEGHTAGTTTVMVWMRLRIIQLLQIVCNLNINRFICKLLMLKIVPLLKGNLITIFELDTDGNIWYRMATTSYQQITLSFFRPCLVAGYVILWTSYWITSYS